MYHRQDCVFRYDNNDFRLFIFLAAVAPLNALGCKTPINLSPCDAMHVPPGSALTSCWGRFCFRRDMIHGQSSTNDGIISRSQRVSSRFRGVVNLSVRATVKVENATINPQPPHTPNAGDMNVKSDASSCFKFVKQIDKSSRAH